MLFVCGDTHGDIDFGKLTSKRFDSKHLTKQDYVLICGDFGGVWDKGGSDNYIQNFYNNKPWTTLFVDGNHENHDALDEYPVSLWNGGKVHMISDSIIHLMRGQVYTIDGRKVFTMGGAKSIDKIFRIEGLSWWAREIPSREEEEEALANLRSNQYCVDYIFTHCASRKTQEKLNPEFENDDVTVFLDTIEGLVDFRHWFFGHYHVDSNVDEKHTALYDNVIRLW